MTRRMLATLAILAAVFAVLTMIAVRSGVLRGPETAAIGGPFSLVDQAGKPADERLLRGKWSAVFFGFTYCPDVCPTALTSLAQVEGLLGKRRKDFQTVFISVDPQRDTVAQMAAYVSEESFPKAIRALTGTPAQTAAAAKAYRVYVQKSGEGPNYLVNHSSIIYLMNPKGRFACVIATQAPAGEIAHKISAAMAKGSNAESC